MVKRGGVSCLAEQPFDPLLFLRPQRPANLYAICDRLLVAFRVIWHVRYQAFLVGQLLYLAR